MLDLPGGRPQGALSSAGTPAEVPQSALAHRTYLAATLAGVASQLTHERIGHLDRGLPNPAPPPTNRARDVARAARPRAIVVDERSTLAKSWSASSGCAPAPTLSRAVAFCRKAPSARSIALRLAGSTVQNALWPSRHGVEKLTLSKTRPCGRRALTRVKAQRASSRSR